MLVELEVIILFFAKFDLSPFGPELSIRPAFLVGQELFLANRVIAGLFVLVDLAFIEEPLQNSLNDFLVSVTCCLGPLVVFHIQVSSKDRQTVCVMLFHEFSRRNACLRSGLLHLLAVLVDAGQKKDIVTFKAMITRYHIGQHHLIGVPDMR